MEIDFSRARIARDSRWGGLSGEEREKEGERGMGVSE